MELHSYIQHPERLDRDSLYELRSLLARYPYYQTARLLFLQNLYLLHDPTFGEELRKAALYVPDCRALFQMIEGKNYEIELHRSVREKNDTSETDRTLSLIDRFLNGLPAEGEKRSNVAINPATDYAAYLMQLDDETEVTATDGTATRTDDLINSFITTHTGERIPLDPLPSSGVEENSEVEEEASEKAEIMDEEGCLTETLARIYIKQRRYSKALEIIRRLSLKNPKKNAYFADQMRFLEKLIINTKNNKE